MSYYSVYGHCFKIDKTLNFLQKSNDELPDFSVYRSDDLDFNHRKISVDIAEYFKDGVGRFRVVNGTDIQYSLISSEDKSFEKSLLYLAIPLLFYQRNFLVLHASCVYLNGKTIMFCGRKGSGKSTYCQHYLSKGGFISEDRCVIDTKNKKQITLNSQISIMKLKALSKKNKNLILDKIAIQDDELGRSCYQLDASVHNRSIKDYKIDHCIFLEWGNDFIIKKTNFQDIFLNSFSNSIKSQNTDIKKSVEREHLINLNNFCSSNVNFHTLVKKRDSDKQDFNLSVQQLDQIIF